MESEAQKNNYTNSSPAQPQVIYVEKPKRSGILKYLLGCGIPLLLFLCLCSLPVSLLANFDKGMSNAQEISTRVSEHTLSNTGNTSSREKAKIAVINISGAISYSVPGTDSQSGAASDNIIAQVEKAKNDTSVNAIILRFNTPGGEVNAAEPTCRAIRALGEKKPVYSFIDSEGASLGYLLPNCTKYIYSRPDSVTGSIGVVIQAVDYYGVLEHFGGKMVFVTNSAGTQKTGQDIYDPASETYKTYQKILDETYNYFLDVVTQGRRNTNPNFQREYLQQYADGRIFSGRQAKQIGLIDELGQFDEVVKSISDKEQLSSKNVNVVEYSISSNPFDQLLHGATGALNTVNPNEALKNTGKIRLLMEAGIVDPRQ